ncbi:MAG: DNA polymerase III subunit gamma/tau [Planctomycetia bacterium]
MAEPAAYQVVARRYRPQRFDELVGQEHVARGLSGAIETGRIGHAYLFTGARGVGKTSAARIYAKALECEQGPAAEPCNACESCRAISSGQDVDVVEIDAASNRGIDEIRQLRQNVAVRPARGRFKIYNIDEVHMLTREAFNALLKTLEEPPAHVKFVLCTTEPEKLPITILSRCQRFDFQTVDPPAIARRLAQIVSAEGASVAQEALDLIARRAAGSMRDSQSLLEQLLGAATGPVGVDEVHAVIGTGREEKVGTLVVAIAARDPRGAIAALDAALAGGADPGGVLEQVIAALRDCLLASVGCGPESLTQGQGLGVDLAALGRTLGTETLLAMLQIIDHALARMRTSGHAAVLAEMAVVRLAKLEDLDNLVALVHAAPADKPTPARQLPAAVAVPAAPSAPAAAGEREKKTTDLTPVAVAAAPLADEAPVEAPVAAVIEAISEATRESLAEADAEPVVTAAPPTLPADAHAAWLQAGEAVGGLVADFAAMASRASWRDELLEVALPGDATTAVSFLRRPEVAASLARVLGEIAGRPLKHTIVVESVAAAPASAVRANSAAAEPAAAERPRAVHSQAALLREVMDHPLVTHARTLFDAAVRKVEPPRPQEMTTVPAASVAADDETAAGEDAASGYTGGTDG